MTDRNRSSSREEEEVLYGTRGASHPFVSCLSLLSNIDRWMGIRDTCITLTSQHDSSSSCLFVMLSGFLLLNHASGRRERNEMS